MAAWIALFISLVSLILMIVILIRFKKLFSTDAIIEKTKAQMNRVIKDVNGNANRDLELINEVSSERSEKFCEPAHWHFPLLTLFSTNDFTTFIFVFRTGLYRQQ